VGNEGVKACKQRADLDPDGMRWELVGAFRWCGVAERGSVADSGDALYDREAAGVLGNIIMMIMARAQIFLGGDWKGWARRREGVVKWYFASS
jgi:hypothetical protein